MTETDTTQAEGETEQVDTTSTDATEEAPDWQARFEAQQKVNRDLERKLKGSWDENRTKVSEMEKALAAAQGKEKEFEALQAQRETEQAAVAKANERILKAEIRAAAAGKLADPADALQFLDLSALEVSADGEVDSEAVMAAIDELVKNKPYLGVTQGDKKFKGTADAGARGNAGKPQLTEADVKQLAAQGKHAEIEQARVDGRLNTLLGIT